jgi:amidase
VRKLFGFNDAVDAVMEDALDVLKREGAKLIDPMDIDCLGKLDDAELTVFLYEFKAGLNVYLKKLGDKAPVQSLKDLIEFNRKNKKKELPYFGQDLFMKAEEKGPLTDKEYKEALESNIKLSQKEGIDAVMDKEKLDALISPTAGPAWMTDLVLGDGGSGGSSQLPAVAGYPHITVPAGQVFGLPVGLSFYGRAWSEGTLIKLAFAFEQSTKARKRPGFLATVDLS